MPKGFSYVQILLIVAIIAVLAASSAPYYLQFQVRQQLQSTSSILLADIRYAQSKAMQQAEHDQWGVHISDSDKEYVLYYGSTYSAAESNNVVIDYPASVSLSPDQDILFEPVTGVPTSGTSTTITVTSSAVPNESFTISINEEGRTSRN